MARQAAGSALLRFGDTMVLAAVTVSPNISTLPFFPLTVEYREKTYAAGKIPGGFLKREGRPSDKEILAEPADRPLDPAAVPGRVQERGAGLRHRAVGRPGERCRRAGRRGRLGRAEPLAGAVERAARGACASAGSRGTGSSIPTFQQLEFSSIDLVVSGSADSIVMVEGGSLEVSEAEMLEALKVAQKGIKEMIGLEKQLIDKAGPRAKIAWSKAEVDPVLLKKIRELAEAQMARPSTPRTRPAGPPASGGVKDDRAGDSSWRRTRSGPARSATSWRTSSTASCASRCWSKGERVDGRDLDTIRPDHHRDRRAAAHPRLGALHPRARPRRWSRSPSAPRTTSSGSTASTWPARPPSRSCCTTTSRRTRPAR